MKQFQKTASLQVKLSSNSAYFCLLAIQSRGSCICLSNISRGQYLRVASILSGWSGSAVTQLIEIGARSSEYSSCTRQKHGANSLKCNECFEHEKMNTPSQQNKLSPTKTSLLGAMYAPQNHWHDSQFEPTQMWQVEKQHACTATISQSYTELFRNFTNFQPLDHPIVLT